MNHADTAENLAGGDFDIVAKGPATIRGQRQFDFGLSAGSRKAGDGDDITMRRN
jgi:hypothetical protein